MDERLKLIAIVAVLAIMGAAALSFFTMVPKGAYDALQKGCEQDAASAAVTLEAEKQKSRYSAEQARDCESEKQGAQQLVEAKNAEIETLQKGADVLARARARADLHEQQRLLLEYYMDAFGPDRVINNEKVQKIEAQLGAIGDAGLTGLWVNVKGCQTLLGCQDAKGRFTGAIAARMSLYANETVGIVKEIQ